MQVRGKLKVATRRLKQMIFKEGDFSSVTILSSMGKERKEQLELEIAFLQKKLKVNAKIIIYPATKKLPQNFSGYFHHEDGVIELKDDDMLFPFLAHEMRHLYQWTYESYDAYQMRSSSVKEYITNPCEVDARRFTIDYCRERKLEPELKKLLQLERDYMFYLLGGLSEMQIGLHSRDFQ